jgi:5-formyltetrahydrofolate cyclo-ligase
VATTVHPLQVLEALPRAPHDLPLVRIATPDESFAVEEPASGPAGIAWELLDEADLEAMPILRELRERA